MSLSTITLAGKDVTLVAMPATPGLRAVEFTAYDGVGMVRSPFSGAVQAQQWHGGDMWSGKATLPSMVQNDADNWIAFLEELRGKFCAFQMSDPLQPFPRGSASGAPVVDNTQNGGNPAGSLFLATQGWTPSATGVLLPGDYIQVGYRLYRNLNQVDSDADGKAVLSIWPSLRETPTNDGTNAGFVNATGALTFSNSRPLGQTSQAAMWSNFQDPALPKDAVITGIYPVIVASANYDGAFQYLQYGSDVVFGNPVHGTAFLLSPGAPGIPDGSFSSTEFDGGSIGISLADLIGQKIQILINTSLFLDGIDDSMTATAVGFAVYYSSATPVIDPQMPAPFTVPSGQGVAWSLPFEVDVIPPNDQGTSTGAAASFNGGIVLDNPLGIFRLADNKRDWAADFQRISSISFPFQEYR